MQAGFNWPQDASIVVTRGRDNSLGVEINGISIRFQPGDGNPAILNLSVGGDGNTSLTAFSGASAGYGGERGGGEQDGKRLRKRRLNKHAEEEAEGGEGPALRDRPRRRRRKKPRRPTIASEDDEGDSDPGDVPVDVARVISDVSRRERFAGPVNSLWWPDSGLAGDVHALDDGFFLVNGVLLRVGQTVVAAYGIEHGEGEGDQHPAGLGLARVLAVNIPGEEEGKDGEGPSASVDLLWFDADGDCHEEHGHPAGDVVCLPSQLPGYIPLYQNPTREQIDSWCDQDAVESMSRPSTLVQASALQRMSAGHAASILPVVNRTISGILRDHATRGRGGALCDHLLELLEVKGSRVVKGGEQPEGAEKAKCGACGLARVVRYAVVDADGERIPDLGLMGKTCARHVHKMLQLRDDILGADPAVLARRLEAGHYSVAADDDGGDESDFL